MKLVSEKIEEFRGIEELLESSSQEIRTTHELGKFLIQAINRFGVQTYLIKEENEEIVAKFWFVQSVYFERLCSVFNQLVLGEL